MPRIDAPTVREHHEAVERRLIDAAEDLLGAGQTLTAGEVSARAGIARNSIYRYVTSVSELHLRVIERHMPAWLTAVEEAMAEVSDPREQVLIWVTENLRQAQETGHAWLIRLASAAIPTESKAVTGYAHTRLDTDLVAAWQKLGSPTPQLHAAFIFGLLDVAFRRLDGADPVDVVIAETTAACSAVIDDAIRRFS